MASELRGAILKAGAIPFNVQGMTTGMKVIPYDEQIDAILEAFEAALPGYDLSGNEIFAAGRNSMREDIKSIINEARKEK